MNTREMNFEHLLPQHKSLGTERLIDAPYDGSEETEEKLWNMQHNPEFSEARELQTDKMVWLVANEAATARGTHVQNVLKGGLQELFQYTIEFEDGTSTIVQVTAQEIVECNLSKVNMSAIVLARVFYNALYPHA